MAADALRELAIGSRGTVLLVPPIGAGIADPDRAATRDRDVSLVAAEPGAGPDDIEAALDRLGVAVGVVGLSSGGLTALALAARRPDLVGRLAIVGTAALSEPGAVAVNPAGVGAKTLLVYGGTNPDATSANGRWWQRALPDARLEMTPDAGDRLLELRWARVLSHLAPRAVRAARRPGSRR